MEGSDPRITQIMPEKLKKQQQQQQRRLEADENKVRWRPGDEPVTSEVSFPKTESSCKRAGAPSAGFL